MRKTAIKLAKILALIICIAYIILAIDYVRFKVKHRQTYKRYEDFAYSYLNDKYPNNNFEITDSEYVLKIKEWIGPSYYKFTFIENNNNKKYIIKVFNEDKMYAEDNYKDDE